MFNFAKTKRGFFITAWSSVAIFGLSSYFHRRIQDRIASSTLFKMCVQEMLENKSSIELLGEPLEYQYPSLRKTHITQTEATICVPVSGSKQLGELMVHAKILDSKADWNIESLKLKTSDKEISLR